MLAGCVVAGAVGACAAAGQMWLARWTRVLVPDQDFTAGNDTWPFQLVLLAWCSASAAVLGVAAGRLVVRNVGWRYVVVAAAGLGACAPQRLAAGWASGAVAVSGDPVAAAGGAVLLGAVVGAMVGTAVLAWRAVALGAVVWVGWVWLNVAAEVAGYEPHRPGRDYVVPVHPLGMFTPTWPGHTDAVTMVAVLSCLLPAALVGWWARRWTDRARLFGVVVGPLLLVAVHLVVRPLPGGRSDGDHYTLVGDVGAWVLVAVLGLGAGALGSGLAGRGRAAGERRPMAAGESGDALAAGAGRRPVTAVMMLLMVAASVLVAAALVSMWSTGGGWLAAGTAAVAFGAAAAHHRGRTLSPVAGAGCAVAGVGAIAVASGMFHDSNDVVLFGPWSIASSLAIVGLIGVLARGMAGAAWSVVAIGGLHAAAPVAAGFVTGSSGQDGSHVLIVGLLGLLSAAIALKVAREGRHAADAPASKDPARNSSTS
ncbi:hypothetical protein Prum_093640 [Phytohabitans rumicis]|uniref:Uncharacterized protein n=2 Tax=Phytohabitans rumicis TaxID=1076125 RepID=A0A6V8LEQ6_9ACTN|nr:hypothetical protein Prum_093640 [Phytohabitans rumicis]